MIRILQAKSVAALRRGTARNMAARAAAGPRAPISEVFSGGMAAADTFVLPGLSIALPRRNFRLRHWGCAVTGTMHYLTEHCFSSPISRDFGEMGAEIQRATTVKT